MAYTPQVSAPGNLLTSFTQADGNLSSTDWETSGYDGGGTNGLKVESNLLAPNGGSQRSKFTLPADHELIYDIVTTAANYHAIFWGIKTPGAGWEAYWFFPQPGVGWEVKKRQGGSVTTVDNAADVTFSAGDKISIYHVGTTIKVRHYTAGAWVETPIIEVDDVGSTVDGSGPIAVEMAGTGWRLDNLVGGAAVAEGGGGPDPDPELGPDEPVTLWVDPDHVAAADDWTRAEAADDATKPFLTPQAAALIARSDVAWGAGDLIRVKPSENANPDDDLDTSVYAFMHHKAINGAGTDLLPFGDNDGNPPIIVRGVGSPSAGTAPKMRVPEGRAWRNWQWENFQLGYDRGSGDDNLTIGTFADITDLSFFNCIYTGGAHYILSCTGECVWDSCEIYSPFSPFAGSGNRFLDGVGFHTLTVDTIDGTERQGTFRFINCHFEDCDGEDAIQHYGGPVALGTELIVEFCTFRNIFQGEGSSAAHTDCIQVLGGFRQTVRQCSFINCDTPFIASDGENGTIIFESNLIDGGGIGYQAQGTTLHLIRHNTFKGSVFATSVAIGSRLVGHEQRVVLENNILEDFGTDPEAVINPASSIKKNIVTRLPGFSGPYGDNLDGLPEFGPSARLSSAGITGAYELANTPTLSPGIGQGRDLTGDPDGDVSTDLLDRPFASPPDVGCLQSSVTVVAPAARAPYVTDLTPTGNGVDPATAVSARLYPKPGESIAPESVTGSSVFVTDSAGGVIPAVIELGAMDGDGFQDLTLDLKASTDPVEEGELFPLVLYTARLTAVIEDTEGSNIAATSWSFRVQGPDGPAITGAPGTVDTNASFTLSAAPWLPGTVVNVHLDRSFPPGAAMPSGPAVTSETVSSQNTVTFTGLTQGIRYVAFAEGRPVRFLVPTPVFRTVRVQ